VDAKKKDAVDGRALDKLAWQTIHDTPKKIQKTLLKRIKNGGGGGNFSKISIQSG